MKELNRPQLSVSPVSPLPRRTGHGDFPHPALAKVVSSRKHSPRYQAQMFQVSIQTDALAGTPAPLTATLQVSPQPIPHEVIELAKRLSTQSRQVDRLFGMDKNAKPENAQVGIEITRPLTSELLVASQTRFAKGNLPG